jgi:hypothetical protein
MDLSKFERVYNRQMIFVIFAFALYVGFAFITTPRPLQSDFFQNNDPMFALIIGALIWMLGTKITIILVKKGLVK